MSVDVYPGTRRYCHRLLLELLLIVDGSYCSVISVLILYCNANVSV